ncbi:MAG: twin-arginine translocase subunit TatC [Bacteroidetes bacterium]|nr:twin-arginine translocase subunit TatC [Bacteroidota bacterium]
MSASKENEKTGVGGFLSHLEDLRWTLVKTAMGLVVTTAFAAYFIDFIFDDILLSPLKQFDPPVHLQNLKPYGQVVLYLQVALFSGLILGIPWVLYQIWNFIQPALHTKEIKYIRFIVIFSSFFFLLGVSFSYFIVIPYSVAFFIGFGSPMIENNLAADEYLSFIIQILLAGGIIFELPMISYFLSKIGVLTPPFMRHYRRYAYFIVVIIAGIITPPDVISQVMLGIPMILLYELSIYVSGIVLKNKLKKEAARAV